MLRRCGLAGAGLIWAFRPKLMLTAAQPGGLFSKQLRVFLVRGNLFVKK